MREAKERSNLTLQGLINLDRMYNRHGVLMVLYRNAASHHIDFEFNRVNYALEPGDYCLIPEMFTDLIPVHQLPLEEIQPEEHPIYLALNK